MYSVLHATDTIYSVTSVFGTSRGNHSTQRHMKKHVHSTHCQLLGHLQTQSRVYTTGRGWGIFPYVGVKWNVLQGWDVFTCFWNDQHLSMFIKKKQLVYSDYTDFLTLINHSTSKPGYGKICVEYILAKSTSPLDRDDIKMDLMFINMKNNIIPVNSTIILSKVIILC